MFFSKPIGLPRYVISTKPRGASSGKTVKFFVVIVFHRLAYGRQQALLFAHLVLSAAVVGTLADDGFRVFTGISDGLPPLQGYADEGCDNAQGKQQKQ